LICFTLPQGLAAARRRRRSLSFWLAYHAPRNDLFYREFNCCEEISSTDKMFFNWLDVKQIATCAMAIGKKNCSFFMVCLPSADLPLTGLFYLFFMFNNLGNS